MSSILGKKIGMTQVFTQDGALVRVTAIEAGPCTVTAIGDSRIQVGFDTHGKGRFKKPQMGYFKKHNITPLKLLREIPRETGKEYKIGDEIKADIFQEGDYIDVIGTSKGKGFQGGMKRWHWHGGPQTHGSMSHRRIGSLGSSTTPGRVWKGHHLPGHMGAGQVTVQNLKVVKIDVPNNILLIEGAVPGYKNSYLMIRTAKKKKVKAAVAQAKPSAKSGAKKK